jgi:hypothetical protein
MDPVGRSSGDILRHCSGQAEETLRNLSKVVSRSQWPCSLRRRSSAARLLRSWVRIQPGAWMFVCCECCVLSGRGLCDGLITHPEKSYRLWRVVACDQETSKTRRLKPATGLWKIQPQWVVTPGKQTTNKVVNWISSIGGTLNCSAERPNVAN